MIFSERNEAGLPLWYLVWLGQKTVTRRKKPIRANHAIPGKPQKDWLRLTGKTIAVQPARTKAAICRHCGGWKEDHNEQIETCYVGKNAKAINIRICSHYEPLRVKVVSCELESEWQKKQVKNNGQLTEEARREGFATWKGLQAALARTNPKELPLFRIEFKRDTTCECGHPASAHYQRNGRLECNECDGNCGAVK